MTKYGVFLLCCIVSKMLAVHVSSAGDIHTHTHNTHGDLKSVSLVLRNDTIEPVDIIFQSSLASEVRSFHLGRGRDITVVKTPLDGRSFFESYEGTLKIVFPQGNQLTLILEKRLPKSNCNPNVLRTTWLLKLSQLWKKSNL